MPERSEGKFRIGESAGKPIGGNVADQAMPQALYDFALSRGFESQNAFAKSINIRNSVVSKWYRGVRVPSAEGMSNIFLVHQPTPVEVEMLIGPWAEQLQAKKRVRKHVQSKTPIGMWIERYVFDHKITFGEFARNVGLSFASARDKMGIEGMERIIENAELLELDAVQTAELVEVVAQTIEEKAAKGHKFKSNSNRAKIAQADLACTTYTPIQAADELGVTREAIRQHRERLKLPLLMNEQQFEILKQDFERTKGHREKTIAGQKRAMEK